MPTNLLSIPFKVRLTGKDADNHAVASYVGTKALHGFTRSVQIVSKAYLNNEAVSRATALHDGNLFITGGKPGSLIFDFRLDVTGKKPDVTLNRNVFFDFCSTIFHRATGREFSPDTAYVKKLDEDTSDDLIDLTVEHVEEALKEAHTAIGTSVTGMAFERPRSGIQTYFDQETKQYIQSSILSEEARNLEGHVTRFNTVTGNGRAYINDLNRIIPFRLESDFLESKRGFITWSLHGSNVHRAKNLILDAQEITSAAGTVKRLAISDCNQAGTD